MCFLGYHDISSNSKQNVSKNVEEGGGVIAFSKKVDEYIDYFLGIVNPLMVINPSDFEIWKQDSKPFQGEASMATLTPTELTQIISESVLEKLQLKGKAKDGRARVCLVYEEAHSLVPEWSSAVNEGDNNATNGTARAILQGRKYGLGCLLITQRTANVTKTILNQCNTVFAMRTFDDTGMNFLSNYIGNEYARTLTTLKARQAIFYGKASSCENPVLIRLNDQDKFRNVFRINNPPPSLQEHEHFESQTTKEGDANFDDEIPF